MKRSFDHVATPSADEGRPDEPLALLLSSTPSCLLRVPSPQKLQELAASVATQQPQDWDSHQASTTVVAARLGHNASTRRLRRRTCDLEVALREEGLIRLVFSFLNVSEHQRIKSCCRSWMKLIQTLALDTLDMSSQSPLTSATIDRAFLSVIHNYSTVRRIDMSGQRSLNDRDLLVLTSCFWSHLEHIVIDDCIDVTDFGLLSILNAQSQRLQSISIRHCKQITGSFSHEQITGRHPSLTTLDVTDTRIPYSVVHGLEHVFPSLQTIHATHTPAHLDCLRLLGWEDLVDELLFLVSNEMSDLPHIDALLEQFACRVSRWRREEEASGRPVSVLHRSLFALGARALLDVPLRRADLMSALLYACENGLTNIIPALVAHGRSDVEATDKDGASALCIAVTNGLTDVARLLLDAGADINKRTRCLATPLYIASEMNWEDVVELLLAYNATPDLPSHRWRDGALRRRQERQPCVRAAAAGSRAHARKQAPNDESPPSRVADRRPSATPCAVAVPSVRAWPRSDRARHSRAHQARHERAHGQQRVAAVPRVSNGPRRDRRAAAQPRREPQLSSAERRRLVPLHRCTGRQGAHRRAARAVLGQHPRAHGRPLDGAAHRSAHGPHPRGRGAAA
ncbi:hypothetical protein PINS_up021945 [Pythium insidiosum]|nr:hypothetical protein PINS_up021945 [Pythium insidiosum]